MVAIVIIPFGSTHYEQSKKLRNSVLRLPIGLMLGAKDTEGEDSQTHIAAIRDEREVVGTVLLKPLAADRVKLRQMAVAASMQGKGLGGTLVRFAEQTARERGFAEIEMHARISALGFYHKLGYREEGEPFTEVTLPTIVMKKTL